MDVEKLKLMKVSDLESLKRRDLVLNRNQLEKNALEQSTLYDTWSSLAEELAADLKDEEDALSHIKSRIELAVRRSSKQNLMKVYKLGDAKEGAIKAIVEVNKLVVQCKERVSELKRRYGKAKGAASSFQMRQSMLKVLKDLYVANYWDKTTSSGTPLVKRRRIRKGRNDDGEFSEEFG